MRIKGSVEVEGLTLHVDIHGDDNQKAFYVTNISSRCLVIPKERWLTRYLGLSKKTLEQLLHQGLTTLDHILDSSWKVRMDLSLDSQVLSELEDAVNIFLDRALVFPEVSEKDQESNQSRFPIQGRVISKEGSPMHIETVPKPLIVERPVEELGLQSKMVRIIKSRYHVETIDDLLGLGRVRIVMTPGLSKKDVDQVDRCLKKLELNYYDASQEKEAANG